VILGQMNDEYQPYCWNCGKDPQGRKLFSITEASDYCKVSIQTIYRWMEDYRVQWILTAGGQRRIYLDSLIKHNSSRIGASRKKPESSKEFE